jgi:hypothetical protein
VKDRFAISRMVLVGDRGMITSARIRDIQHARADEHRPFVALS